MSTWERGKSVKTRLGDLHLLPPPVPVELAWLGTSRRLDYPLFPREFGFACQDPVLDAYPDPTLLMAMFTPSMLSPKFSNSSQTLLSPQSCCRLEASLLDQTFLQGIKTLLPHPLPTSSLGALWEFTLREARTLTMRPPPQSPEPSMACLPMRPLHRQVTSQLGKRSTVLAPAANRAVVPRLSPRMREQVLEHAIMQGEDSVLEGWKQGRGSSATGAWGGEDRHRSCHLPESDRRAKKLGSYTHAPESSQKQRLLTVWLCSHEILEKVKLVTESRSMVAQCWEWKRELI